MKKLYKLILVTIILTTFLFCIIPVSAKSNKNQIRVYDYANILTKEETKELTEKSIQFDSYDMCVVFLTIKDAEDKTTSSYADDFYETHVKNDNGILFIIDKDNQEFFIDTRGFCVNLFTDKDMDYILENTYYYAIQEKYFDCFKEALNLSSNFITENSTKPQSIITPTIFSLTLSITLTVLFIGILIILHNKPHIKHKTPVLLDYDVKIVSCEAVFLGDVQQIKKNYYKPNHSTQKSEKGG